MMSQLATARMKVTAAMVTSDARQPTDIIRRARGVVAAI